MNRIHIKHETQLVQFNINYLNTTNFHWDSSNMVDNLKPLPIYFEIKSMHFYWKLPIFVRKLVISVSFTYSDLENRRQL